MVRICTLLLLLVFLAGSCCIRRPTHAQSDRLDTHNPFLPIIECIPCATQKNAPHRTLWTEAWGTSGKWMVGGEAGYNFNHWRIFADAGTHWWPSGSMTWAHREQIGAVLFDPDLFIRPETGIGLHQRYYRSGTTLVTPVGDQFVKTPPQFMWQSFFGLRANIPSSNMELSIKAIRLQQFNRSNSDWNVGVQLSFRL